MKNIIYILTRREMHENPFEDPVHIDYYTHSKEVAERYVENEGDEEIRSYQVLIEYED